MWCGWDRDGAIASRLSSASVNHYDVHSIGLHVLWHYLLKTFKAFFWTPYELDSGSTWSEFFSLESPWASLWLEFLSLTHSSLFVNFPFHATSSASNFCYCTYFFYHHPTSKYISCRLFYLLQDKLRKMMGWKWRKNSLNENPWSYSFEFERSNISSISFENSNSPEQITTEEVKELVMRMIMIQQQLMTEGEKMNEVMNWKMMNPYTTMRNLTAQHSIESDSSPFHSFQTAGSIYYQPELLTSS